ncbi:uncharacterized protein LOC144503074 isoform X2 [Mustelus asterias]
MAEGRQTLGNQQEQDINHAMESDVGVRREGACSSSGDLTICIQANIKKIQITISPNATGLQLCEEISNQFADIEVKDMRLIHKGKELDKAKRLKEQSVKNKAKIMLNRVNEEKRGETQILSRIKKGAELLAKQDEDFGKPYLKIVNHKGEIIEVPEEERVVILTALILHEVGRSKMKKSNYQEALEFLDCAENQFRECDEGQLNSIDNYGVLNLDVTWCNLQLRKIECLIDAGERLKKAQEYFNNCFGENEERLQQLEDDSGRHKILYLRLHLLWGVYFYHKNMEKDALKELTQAEAQLKALRLDDVDVVCLTNEGFTTREARLALRATGGDMEKARLYIEKKRERAQQQRGEAEERRERLRRRAEAAGGLQQEREQQQHRAGGDEGGEQLRAGNNPAQAVSDVNSFADQANQVSPQNTNPSQPVDRTAPSRPPAPTSPPPGSENNDEILKEILSLLPLDADDYIDVTLEEEEELILEYLAKLTPPVKEAEEDAPPAPKKKRQIEKVSPQNTNPSQPVDRTAPSRPPAPTSPPPGSENNDEILKEILSLLPLDADDYIDVTLEEEEELILEYLAKLTPPVKEAEEDAPPAPKKKRQIEKDFPAVPSPSDPDEDPTPVPPSPNTPSPDVQPEPTADIVDQPDIPDPRTILNSPEYESNITDNPGLTINDEKEEPEQVKTERGMTAEEGNRGWKCCFLIVLSISLYFLIRRIRRIAH